MNRNTVILDGQSKIVPGGAQRDRNRSKANDVWIENLTVRNFERESRRLRRQRDLVERRRRDRQKSARTAGSGAT